MKNTNKKGFTIVELVIVIAVIAILAAVLIPTFASIVKKAQQSADYQAVAQMNKILTAAQATDSLIVEGDDAQSSINIYKALIAEGYSYEFDAYYAKYDFGYVVENGNAVIVLVEDGKVVVPKDYEGETNYKPFFIAVENADDLLAAFDTGYVLMKTDAVFTETIGISDDITIVGNQKLLNDSDISYDSAANSIININGASENIAVNMSGLTISKEREQAYARGINLGNNTGKVTLVLDDVDVESYYYALNITASNAGGVDIIVRNSKITGWTALNVWSKVNVTFENCVLSGNDRSTSNENFGTIVINAEEDGSKAAGSTFTFKNCTIEANTSTNNPNMNMVDVRANATLTFEGCTFKVNGNEVDALTQNVEDGVVATITVK